MLASIETQPLASIDTCSILEQLEAMTLEATARPREHLHHDSMSSQQTSRETQKLKMEGVSMCPSRT